MALYWMPNGVNVCQLANHKIVSSQFVIPFFKKDLWRPRMLQTWRCYSSEHFRSSLFVCLGPNFVQVVRMLWRLLCWNVRFLWPEALGCIKFRDSTRRWCNLPWSVATGDNRSASRLPWSTCRFHLVVTFCISKAVHCVTTPFAPVSPGHWLAFCHVPLRPGAALFRPRAHDRPLY